MKFIALGSLVLAALASMATMQRKYWTEWHSEETIPPAVCEYGDLITGFGCSGGFCDNVRLNCETKGFAFTSRYWTRHVSDEKDGTCQSSSNGYFDCNWDVMSCGSNGFMTGVSCKGQYCDNLSLECVTLRDNSRSDCRWSDWVSEENGGTLQFPAGYYAAGMQCSGSNCDNLRFYICRAVPNRR